MLARTGGEAADEVGQQAAGLYAAGGSSDLGDMAEAQEVAEGLGGGGGDHGDMVAAGRFTVSVGHL
jgi:hypothetical protein